MLPKIFYPSKIYCIGVWDLCHEGHRNLLKKASKLGEVFVGVIKDKAIKKEKGENRPIISESQRLSAIKDLKYVTNAWLENDFIIPNMILEDQNYLIILGEDQNHIKNLNNIPNSQKIYFPRTEGISTSDIIKRIKNGT